MRWMLSRMFWWALSLAMIAVLGRAAWAAYAIVAAGESLAGVPIPVLAFDVMHLHVAAAWGAGAGAIVGLLARLPRWLRIGLRLLGRRDATPDDDTTPDAIIRAERARTAEAWLAGRNDRDLDYVGIGEETDEDAPTVENVITARGGRFTYRVMAYRHLTEQERKELVLDALERGLIQEPEPGGTTTLVTSIGRDD